MRPEVWSLQTLRQLCGVAVMRGGGGRGGGEEGRWRGREGREEVDEGGEGREEGKEGEKSFKSHDGCFDSTIHVPCFADES